MEEAMTALYAVATAIVAAAAIFTGMDVCLSLEAARGYFNIRYKPEHGTGFCRARLVGRVCRPGGKALYLVEIHPKDAAGARAWTVPETGLQGVYLLEKEKFYKLASEEELYGRTEDSPQA